MAVMIPHTARAWKLLWLGAAVAGSIAWFLGPALQWNALQTPCRVTAACRGFQLDVAAAHSLAEHGISMTAYAAATVAIFTAFWMVWYGSGALIIVRKPDDRGALLTAFFFVVLPGLAATLWAPENVANALSGVVVAMLLLFGLLFPNGRFAPRGARWIAVAILLFFFVTSLPVQPEFLQYAGTGILVALFFAGVAMQVYRFRVLSNWTERQRMKWAMLGLSTATVGIVALWTAGPLLPISSDPGSVYFAFVNGPGSCIVASAIPVAIGISILRHRLWDIDRVISHALAWSVLTVILAGVYVVGVLGLQAVFGAFVGDGSAPAIAVSTLVIVALFGPLRRRIQVQIDRRFYRSRYDAARTVAVFGERMRNQVDIQHLSGELMGVVQETLRPEHVSLWLRDTRRS